MDLNEHTRLILGQPNFRCSQIAELLRRDGRDIPRKSEEEQAYVIHWLLSLHESHGETWMQHFNSTILRIVKALPVPVECNSTGSEGKQ